MSDATFMCRCEPVEKICQNAKPIIFNTDMVSAILEDRKTVTRRLIKPRSPKACGFCVARNKQDGLVSGVYDCYEDGRMFDAPQTPPYSPGDILYVKETWTIWDGDYEYKADVDSGYGPFCSSCTLDICAGDCNSVLKWHPSIHMPREAARIFLRVTDVRAERLQDITEEQAVKEGFAAIPCDHPCGYPCTDCMNTGYLEPAALEFFEIWNSVIKPKDRAIYGWEANPWVWVIEFERISKEEALSK